MHISDLDTPALLIDLDIMERNLERVSKKSRTGDKEYNLGVMDWLVGKAVAAGAEVVSFHEVCIPAYSFVQPFSKDRLRELAEPVPDGESTKALLI